MKHQASFLLSIMLLCTLKPAFADSFTVGQHVHVGSLNEDGTVLVVGNGASPNMIKVHLNKLGNAFPSVGSWFDSELSHITAGGGGGAGGAGGGGGGGNAAQPQGQQAARQNPGKQAQGDAAQDPPVQISNNAQPNAALFKQLIIKHYQDQNDTGQTKSVRFKTFTVGAATQYEAVYKGATTLGARGHSYNAWPVHTTYTVLTHNSDPQAADTEQDYGIDWMCYKDNGVEWIASQVGQFLQPGWPREIQKR